MIHSQRLQRKSGKSQIQKGGVRRFSVGFELSHIGESRMCQFTVPGRDDALKPSLVELKSLMEIRSQEDCHRLRRRSEIESFVDCISPKLHPHGTDLWHGYDIGYSGDLDVECLNGDICWEHVRANEMGQCVRWRVIVARWPLAMVQRDCKI